MRRHPGYPFDPRSTAHVRPGDFWAITTRRGHWYCCGQVLAISDLTTMRSLVVALLDWCEPDLPTASSVANVAVVDFGVAHVKTVRETGGMLLGRGDPPTVAGIGSPNLPVWGYRHIEGLAHRHFGRHFPDSVGPAVERPPGIVR